MNSLSRERGYFITPYNTQPDTTVDSWETNPRNVPVVLDHRYSNGQVLKVIGVDHFTTPDNPHYAAVVSEFYDFEVATKGQSRVVLVEGGIRTIESTADDAYRKGSESSLLAFLADQHGIPQDCIEPPHYGIEWLIGSRFASPELGEIKFCREDYVAWLTAMYGPVWLRRMAAREPSQRQSYDEYVLQCLQKEQDELGWYDIDFSAAGLRENYRRQSGRDFDPDDKQRLLRQSLGIPNTPTDRIEAFARQRYIVRHRHLAMGYDFLLREGFSICSTLGTPNVWALERAIDMLRPGDRDQTFSLLKSLQYDL